MRRGRRRAAGDDLAPAEGHLRPPFDGIAERRAHHHIALNGGLLVGFRGDRQVHRRPAIAFGVGAFVKDGVVGRDLGPQIEPAHGHRVVQLDLRGDQAPAPVGLGAADQGGRGGVVDLIDHVAMALEEGPAGIQVGAGVEARAGGAPIDTPFDHGRAQAGVGHLDAVVDGVGQEGRGDADGAVVVGRFEAGRRAEA